MAGDPDTFRVGPSLSRMPVLSAAPVDNKAPAQLVAAGQAVQRTGAQASDIFQNVLREQNETRVTEALVNLTERRNQRTYDPDEGYTALRGKAALERPDGKSIVEEYGGMFDEDAERLSLSLGNDAQRRIFAQRAQAMGADFRERLTVHAANESKTYQVETFGAQADLGVRQMSLAQTPEELEEGRQIATLALGRLGALKGMSEEQLASERIKLLTPAHTAQIARYMDAEDVDQAEAYFNTNRGEMDADAIGRVEGALIEQRTIKDAHDLADEVFEYGAAAATQSQPEDIGMPILGQFRQTGSFGESRPGHRHGGIDYAVPIGTEVRAGASGTVRIKSDPNGYGQYVDLELADGTKLRMAHLSAVDVEDGAQVSKGQVIARSGNSGRSTGPHLHYEVIGKDGNKTNPATFHQGRPRTAGTPGGASMASQIEQVMGLGLPPKTEARAIERLRLRHQLARDERSEQQEQVRSQAFAEVDRTGSLTPAMISRLTSQNMGDLIPSLRSFERSKQERESGVTLSDDMAMTGYGEARIAIARGQVTSLDQLVPFKYILPDAQYRSLVNEFSSAPQDVRARTERALRLVNEEIAGSGLFVDEDGKRDAKAYARFVGLATSTLEGRRLNGQPTSYEDERRVVLGLMRNENVDGKVMPAFEVRALYEAVPPRARLSIVRTLERQNRPASMANTVEMWNAMTDAGRARYTGGR